MSWPQAADLGLTGPALVLPGPAEVAAAACAWVAELCTGSREFHIALAGGSTPRQMYEHMSREYKTEVDWSRWHVWFGDERAVAPDGEASNYRMADVSLLRTVGIPENQVHRMPADDSSLADGASRYNTALSETMPQLRGMPRFDLVLLGLGEDGHTASLFPGDPALSVQDRACTTSRAANEPRNRLTLTYAAINSAAHVAFLVTGSGKGAALRAVQERSVPAAAVKPQDGELVWFLDQAAVDSLQSAGQSVW
ncbi:MAG TPA: 6-phosphogluconolactonase [Candidatus Micrarchaeaceae archaeon]|nr:6-phosphogluconolactonase [Candidatus Micrarchaeaceae archaeon]